MILILTTFHLDNITWIKPSRHTIDSPVWKVEAPHNKCENNSLDAVFSARWWCFQGGVFNRRQFCRSVHSCPPPIRGCKYRVVLVRTTHRTLPRRFPLVQFVGLQLRTGQSLIVHRQRSVSKHRQSCFVEHDKQLFNIETNKNTDVQIFSHRRHQHIQTNSSVITRGSGSLVTFWWTATACKRSFSWFRCNHWHRNFWRPLFLFIIYLLLLFLFMCFISVCLL